MTCLKSGALVAVGVLVALTWSDLSQAQQNSEQVIRLNEDWKVFVPRPSWVSGGADAKKALAGTDVYQKVDQQNAIVLQLPKGQSPDSWTESYWLEMERFVLFNQHGRYLAKDQEREAVRRFRESERATCDSDMFSFGSQELASRGFVFFTMCGKLKQPSVSDSTPRMGQISLGHIMWDREHIFRVINRWKGSQFQESEVSS